MEIHILSSTRRLLDPRINPQHQPHLLTPIHGAVIVIVASHPQRRSQMLTEAEVSLVSVRRR